jgi:hypothetical protein
MMASEPPSHHDGCVAVTVAESGQYVEPARVADIKCS